MTLDAYREEIKLRLTGNVLELELDDATIDKVIYAAFRELQRYICSTKIVTIPFQRCIDLTKYKVSSVSRIYRSEGYIGTNTAEDGMVIDPMQASQWQLLSGVGNIYNFQNFAYSYMAWNTLLQLRNTMSTDLAFRYDKSSNKLYINISSGQPSRITVEFVPRYDSPEEIVSDYWIDMLIRLAVALTKVTLGRIRSRYTQSNALWSQDGDKMLEEGNSELNELRTYLQTNSQLVYPID